MTERMIRTDGAELATQTYGERAHPPVLFIMGGMASMLWWPDAFCEALAGRGRLVIRYDHRDTGRSTKYPVGEPGYTFDDMVEDVIRVLGAYAVPAAHVVGMSLGGMIGQVAALKHPSRVLSLTAISTSPVGADSSQLPSFTKDVIEHMDAADRLDWSDRDQVIAYMVADSRVLAGRARPFDEKRVRAFIARDHDRSGGYLNAAMNHATLTVGEAWRGRLQEIKAPVLVIHGTADPIYPLEHGAALANAVVGATFVRLEGGGHELHEADWDTIIAAIIRHTSR